MKQLPQWVARQHKIPINPHTGNKAQSNNADTWGDFEAAVVAAQSYPDKGVDGIGIMCGNGLCAIDIDHCVENGVLSPLAAEIVQEMNSYTELSLSGTGVHIYFTGTLEKRSDMYTKNPNNGVEVYGDVRHIAITGNSLGDPLPLGERTKEAAAVKEKHMRRPDKPEKAKKKTPKATSLMDDEILLKAKSSNNADAFIKLWNGNITGYPSQSEADIALCGKLAFWSGGNADTVDRLFRASKLYREEKWNRPQSGSTYGAITVKNAIDNCPEFYNPIPSQGVYFMENGNVYRRMSEKESRHLANFTAYPLEDVTKDDGSGTTQRYMTIGGKLASGQSLQTVSIAIAKLGAMTWIDDYWDLSARIQPGGNNKDYFRDYIKSQCEGVQRKTVYTHTGFREVEGKLCFLFHGGALGADNIQCELDGKLSDYTFLDPNGVSEKEALTEVMELFKLAPPEISYALLAYTYLAPLNYFLDKEGIAPSFSLFSVGPTSCGKTTASLLYLSHFRKYKGMSDGAPASFTVTSNAIEKLCFDAKDALMLIDDYHPSDVADKKRMDGIAQRLARGIGDHSSRARMNSDASLKTSYPPRGLVMASGEDMPNIGQSGLARYYFVKYKNKLFDKEDPASMEFVIQRQNNAHKLNIAMQGYIKWLITNETKIQNQIKSDYFDLIRCVNIKNSHSRTVTTIAWLQLALVYFSHYAHSTGLFTLEEGQQFCNYAWAIYSSGGVEQAEAQAEETPVIKFLTALDEIMAAERMYVEEKDGKTSDSLLSSKCLGYHDKDYFYLFPSVAYNAVCEFLKEGGEYFPVSKNALFSALAEAGHIYTKGKNNTPQCWIRSKNSRYLVLKKSALENLKECYENGQNT